MISMFVIKVCSILVELTLSEFFAAWHLNYFDLLIAIIIFLHGIHPVF